MSYKPRMPWPTRVVVDFHPQGEEAVFVGALVEFDTAVIGKRQPNGELNYRRRIRRYTPGESIRKFRAQVLEDLAGLLHDMAQVQLDLERSDEVEEVKKELQGDC